jgi:hypothetical protein
MARSMHEAMMPADLRSSDASARASYLANESTITNLLYLFMEVGSGQMQVICQRHSEDLAKWLMGSPSAVDEGGAVLNCCRITTL